ncbi:MAG: DUF5060 domain-containing protein [Bacteroides sp.]|nr:DUF5060 domain-containing protein [Bacteroides sp.]
MKLLPAFSLSLFFLCSGLFGQSESKVWQKVEIVLDASLEYENPYKDVEVWIQLKGPDFDKKCYGFWDGDNTWRIRVMATSAGEWSWTSASNQNDDGLNGKTGTFSADDWTPAEMKENPLRRGMIRPTENGHAFEYADGTPMFWLADTWWSCMTRRYFWYEDDSARTVGSAEAGFKDYVAYRKSQGFNGCMVIAAFPNWTAEKSDWGGGDWEDESGNRAFFGKGNAPDLDRINPAYFQNMDRKVDFLNENGFIPFIESSRRDIGSYWKDNFDWPESYALYIRYLCFRYQGNIVINSPIHLDYTALSGEEWNKAANIIMDRYDWAPFGHQASANPPASTLNTFGHTQEARWLTFHSVGNERNHTLFPSLTAMFLHPDPVPCLHNEPYYDGLQWGDTASLGSDLAAYYCRVALYGSVLSGGLAGFVYGADHIWDGDEQMPEAFTIQSAPQMQFIYKFLGIDKSGYQELAPSKQLLSSYQTPNEDKNMGWAYCMRSEAKNLFLLYFEKGCQRAILSGALPNVKYKIHWFNPSTGDWIKKQGIKSDRNGEIVLPEFPDETRFTERDWAVKLFH